MFCIFLVLLLIYFLAGGLKFLGLGLYQLKIEHYLSSLKQTIIHVSHVPETFKNYQRLIWIDEGIIQADGTPKTVIKKYRTAMKNYDEKTI